MVNQMNTKHPLFALYRAASRAQIEASGEAVTEATDAMHEILFKDFDLAPFQQQGLKLESYIDFDPMLRLHVDVTKGTTRLETVSFRFLDGSFTTTRDPDLSVSGSYESFQADLTRFIIDRPQNKPKPQRKARTKAAKPRMAAKSKGQGA